MIVKALQDEVEGLRARKHDMVLVTCAICVAPHVTQITVIMMSTVIHRGNSHAIDSDSNEKYVISSQNKNIAVHHAYLVMCFFIYAIVVQWNTLVDTTMHIWTRIMELSIPFV